MPLIRPHRVVPERVARRLAVRLRHPLRQALVALEWTATDGQLWQGGSWQAAERLPLRAATDPFAIAAAGPGRCHARLVGRLLWAARDRGGTVFRLLAEQPDGSGRGMQIDGRADGLPFGPAEPLRVPDHPVAIAGLLRAVPDLDQRGRYTRLFIEATAVDLRPQPSTARTPEARLRQAVEYLYSFNAREPRLYFRDYRYDPATRTLHLSDWSAGDAGLAFVLARGLADRPEVDTLIVECYDYPPERAGEPAGPRQRFHARFRRERLAGVHWEHAYPSTLRLLADEWRQPRGLGGQDFRGLDPAPAAPVGAAARSLPVTGGTWSPDGADRPAPEQFLPRPPVL